VICAASSKNIFYAAQYQLIYAPAPAVGDN